MAKIDNQDIVLYASGDIGPERTDPGSTFRHVSDVIKQGDPAFVQLEVNLSDRGTGRKENARSPRTAAVKKAGFNIVSLPGNHCLDAGVNAFLTPSIIGINYIVEDDEVVTLNE
jgi:hypothetical protein